MISITALQALIIGIIITFCISVALTGIIIPKILLIAFRKKLFDEPDERKIHKGAIPRLGGIAFVPALIFSVGLTIGIFNLPFISIGNIEYDAELVRSISFGLCGLVLLYLVGIADDLVGIQYRAKFVIQIISAVLLVCGGLWINNLNGFCDVYEWPDILGCLLTLLVTVFFVNAINLIDGIDGLASGLSAVALTFYGIIFAVTGDLINALISFGLLGALLQFFYYNVFGNPNAGKKIFMGDTGALCVGYVLTYLSVAICHLPSICNTPMNTVVVAFSPMIVPCFDVLRVFFGRIRSGNSPFLPDKTHIHHKLLNLGMKTPHAMICILSISVFIVLMNVALSQIINSALILAIDLVLWTVFNMMLSKIIKSRNTTK
jgi:UDP-N-acetylmuramyl pentapeptide phosphotransferase/UDP-N-acetylglucosamine-1-phosphate transferase